MGEDGIDFGAIGGDYGDSLGDELAAALNKSGNSSSLFSDDGGMDLSAMLNSFNPDDYKDAFASGDLSNFLDPTQYADLYASGDNLMGSGRYETNLNLSQLEKGFDLGKARELEMEKASAYDPLAALREYGVQDLGISQNMIDEFNKNFNPAGGFGSQWQTVGTNRVMIHDDGTASVMDPTTGQSTYMTKDQVDALVKNGTLNSKDSGYVGATGGKDNIPGGGKTVINSDGTKTVTTTDGKTYVIEKDGTVRDVTKYTGGGGGGGGGGGTPPKTDTNMLLMLLALMALMNKGGSSSTGASTATIPELTASRSQLPYGKASGSTARPGAGGVNYFSPMTYTPKAAGGGLMALAGGGMSDLGSYSDGGHLLRGPGDGVSDSIPATIGDKQPARLATGEFVVPARIVSELGNGSTDAGAKRLYEMMDRVQNTRRKTKNVATDTKAHKYLPA